METKSGLFIPLAEGQGNCSLTPSLDLTAATTELYISHSHSHSHSHSLYLVNSHATVIRYAMPFENIFADTNIAWCKVNIKKKRKEKRNQSRS